MAFTSREPNPRPFDHLAGLSFPASAISLRACKMMFDQTHAMQRNEAVRLQETKQAQKCIDRWVRTFDNLSSVINAVMLLHLSILFFIIDESWLAASILEKELRTFEAYRSQSVIREAVIRSTYVVAVYIVNTRSLAEMYQ
jgi:hypothetical protein